MVLLPETAPPRLASTWTSARAKTRAVGKIVATARRARALTPNRVPIDEAQSKWSASSINLAVMLQSRLTDAKLTVKAKRSAAQNFESIVGQRAHDETATYWEQADRTMHTEEMWKQRMALRKQ